MKFLNNLSFHLWFIKLSFFLWRTDHLLILCIFYKNRSSQIFSVGNHVGRLWSFLRKIVVLFDPLLFSPAIARRESTFYFVEIEYQESVSQLWKLVPLSRNSRTFLSQSGKLLPFFSFERKIISHCSATNHKIKYIS